MACRLIVDRAMSTKRLLHSLFVAAALSVAFIPLSPSTAGATGYITGATITGLDVRADGYFLLTLSSDLFSSTAGRTVHNRVWGNANEAGGKNMLATATAAFLAGRTVNVEGNNCAQTACGAPWGGTIEGMAFIQVN
jgi:hypothetical protein